MKDEEIVKLNHLGLIPGPGEEEEAFKTRVNYCLHLTDQLPKELGEPNKTIISPSLMEKYDFFAEWVPLYFSNDKLAPWHGGCAWIFQMNEESPTAALIQLRDSFRTSKKYLGLYDRDELLRHELVHVARMKYEEPKFEEVLAYDTSSSPLRRWFGGLIQSSRESMFFVLLLGMIVVFDLFLVATNRPEAYLIAFWLKLIPLGLLLLALVRVWKKRRIYSSCVSNLSKINKEKAEAIAFRLTDEEIKLFSAWTPEKIKEYAETKAKEELRWRFIKVIYF